VAARVTRFPFVASTLKLALIGSIVGSFVVGCGIGAANGPAVTFPPESFGPSAGTTGAVAATHAALVQALGNQGLQLADPQVAFRPPESPRLAAAPRAVFQVVLPQDSTHGFISVYEFPDAATANETGRDQAAYIATGPGRVQFPPDSRFVIRQLGPTIIFYSWSPASAADPRTRLIQQALETVGLGIPVPS
jgi:hypothetical protein